MNKEGAPGEKLAAQVARRIEEDIIDAGWPVGTVIGSELALIERYGVSRAVFREAVRIVEHHQVAITRRGPAGGLVVRAPDEAAVATAVGVYLEHVGVTIESILHARHIVESLAATLAPSRITEDGIGILRGILNRQATEDPSELSLHHQLHHAIAATTGNPVVVLFLDVLNALTLRYSAREYSAARRSIAPSLLAERSERVHRDHVAIAEAVIGGDAARAEHLATEHLNVMHEWITSPSTGGVVRRLRSTAPGLTSTADGTVAPSKLAETVAGRIHEDVTQAGLPAGAVIGSESDLLARYGVSRSVLREAVRLLEYHSVAQMRRGPGGGLVVGEPDPSATIEATALYLEYTQAGVEDLRIVRNALELSCIDILVERRDPELLERLTALLAIESTGRDDSFDDPSGDDNPHEDGGFDRGDEFDNGGAPGHRLHLELARLTGNEALASFVRVLTAVWPRHLARAHARADGYSGRQPPAGAVAAAPVRLDGPPQHRAADRAAHRGILEAVIDGDRGLARHRMRRHLETLTAVATPPAAGRAGMHG
ncbi:FadR/GntR family transcriptional regulator [Frankia sp. AgB32]|uniref:FadR/GntR family transcriptional regulator n=1 Tax=Frankia sp. AgB32 TaxID=631119 RepID=UPI00200CF2BC|nr:FCD domain-containing protein [Frankia sp. AgB32]MCK9897724.1 FCD domain-containing protein [Frankia sp. AgB32]